MTAATLDQAPARAASRPAPAPIPMSRIVGVELRKMFDTRSGFWLMVGMGVSALVATAAVVIWAPDSSITYDSFGAAVGVPMTLLLPVMAILAVTSEWSQRSGLTTFTLVPHRGRVIGAKAVVSVAVGVASILVALAIGAVGNLVGSTLAGVDTVWDISLSQVLCLLLANALNLMIGFMLGVLIRNSPGAIVAYVVYNFVLPPLSMLLATSQHWWDRAGQWLDYNRAQAVLYDGGLTGTQWAHLGVAAVIWLVVPLGVGLVLLRRSEVK